MAPKTEVFVTKPRAGFGEEDIPLAYGAVSSIDFPLSEYVCATSRFPDSLSEIHLFLQTTRTEDRWASMILGDSRHDNSVI